MQAQWIALMTQAEGISHITDKVNFIAGDAVQRVAFRYLGLLP